MDHKRLFDHIYGSLACVAVGDALGFPVHELASEEIHRRYGGPVDRMLPAFDDDIIHIGFGAGQVTDDTILTIVTARALLEAHGKIEGARMARYLGTWARENPDVWVGKKVFGPTTQAMFRRFMDGKEEWKAETHRWFTESGSSNGSVMRIAPAGLIHPGQPETAAELAYEVTAPTHGTQVAISAAAAQAAGVAAALAENAEVLSVVDAALKGAEIGEKLGRAKARVIAAPSIVRRIEVAVEQAIKASDPFDAGLRIQSYFGSHLPAAEAMPMGIGVFVAAKGDPKLTMMAAATTGGDTDTIASIGGALAGALRGIETVPQDWLEFVEQVNQLGLKGLATDLTKLAADA